MSLFYILLATYSSLSFVSTSTVLLNTVSSDCFTLGFGMNYFTWRFTFSNYFISLYPWSSMIFAGYWNNYVPVLQTVLPILFLEYAVVFAVLWWCYEFDIFLASNVGRIKHFDIYELRLYFNDGFFLYFYSNTGYVFYPTYVPNNTYTNIV